MTEQQKKLEDLLAIKNNMLAAVQGIDKEIQVLQVQVTDDKAIRRAQGRADANARAIARYSNKKKRAA